MDQQDKQKQNKKGIFIDFKTLRDAKSSADISAGLSFLVFISSIIGVIFANNIMIQMYFIVITIISAFAMGAADYSYSKLDRFTPKVRKIVKEIICYEDGQTEETKEEYCNN